MPDIEHSTTQNPNKNVPCRTCTDFKSWAKEQRGMMGISSPKVPTTTAADTQESKVANSHKPNKATEFGCPYDKDDLGRSTWGLLHTMAANYPEKPSVTQEKEISTFFNIFSKFYPCDVCAKDFQQEIKSEPLNASSQNAFAQWLCRIHNKVNVKLGKPVFDCRFVNQRWRDGWDDGSCDM